MKKILAILLTTLICQIALAEVDVTYDSVSGLVHIPQVRVIGDDSGTTYTVDMVNGNNGAFYITSLTENIPETVFNKDDINQQFTLKLMDVTSFIEGGNPIPEELLGLSFYMNDVEFFIDLSGLTANTTYVELMIAIEEGIKNLPAEYRGGFSVSIGEEFNVWSSVGFSYLGTQIILKSHLYDSITSISWVLATISASSEIYANISDSPIYYLSRP